MLFNTRFLALLAIVASVAVSAQDPTESTGVEDPAASGTDSAVPSDTASVPVDSSVSPLPSGTGSPSPSGTPVAGAPSASGSGSGTSLSATGTGPRPSGNGTSTGTGATASQSGNGAGKVVFGSAATIALGASVLGAVIGGGLVL